LVRTAGGKVWVGRGKKKKGIFMCREGMKAIEAERGKKRGGGVKHWMKQRKT